MSLNFESLNSLSSKRIIGVLIKLNHGFYTPLEDFEKPDDAALIGVFSNDLKSSLVEGYEKYFDAVFWFDIDAKTRSLLNEGSQAEHPQLEDIISKVAEVLPKEKLDLISTEEQLTNVLCKIREKLEIPGPKIKDLEHFLDLSSLKTTAKTAGLPMLKFTVLNLAKINSIKAESRRIVTEIQKFPISYTPIIAGCNISSGKIKNEDDLKKFILQESKSVKKGCYLLEECIDEKELTEFWIWCSILVDGTCVPYSCSFGKKGLSNVEHLKTGEPMLFHACPLNDKCDEIFPKITEFAKDVATKLKPPGPHIFGVQGFQRQPKTSNYFFKDVCYGITGKREASVSFNGTNISLETTALSCHLNPNFTQKCDNHKTSKRTLWYPFVKGTLQNQNEIPKTNQVTSKLEYQWFIDVNQKMENAICADDYMLCLSIENEDEKVLEKDIEWIEKNYHPNVIKDGTAT